MTTMFVDDLIHQILIKVDEETHNEKLGDFIRNKYAEYILGYNKSNCDIHCEKYLKETEKKLESNKDKIIQNNCEKELKFGSFNEGKPLEVIVSTNELIKQLKRILNKIIEANDLAKSGRYNPKDVEGAHSILDVIIYLGQI